MPQTWLQESSSPAVRAFRAAWLMSLYSGLVQKPRISLAWDVRVTMEAMRSVTAVTSVPEVLGMTLILLRQVYAEKGQQLVAAMACRQARSRQGWTIPLLRSLLAALEKMDNADAMKLKGRMPRFTGPMWMRTLLADTRHVKVLRLVGRVIGKILLAPAGAGPTTFGDLCLHLQGAGKLPHICKYGIAGILRCLSAVLVDTGRPALILLEAHWAKHVRDMTPDTTSVAFRMAGVVALADAERMVAVLKASIHKYWGFRKAAQWSQVNVLDLSCQSCEFMQVLRVVQASFECIHDHGAAAKWLLEHLPKDVPGLRAMSKSLSIRREKVQGRGNGRDLQAGSVVAADWLRTRFGQDASVGRGVKARSPEVVVRLLERFLPPSSCQKCRATLQPPFRTCSTCARRKTQAKDRLRNRGRFHRDGKRVRAPSNKRARKM